MIFLLSLILIFICEMPILPVELPNLNAILAANEQKIAKQEAKPAKKGSRNKSKYIKEDPS